MNRLDFKEAEMIERGSLRICFEKKMNILKVTFKKLKRRIRMMI